MQTEPEWLTSAVIFQNAAQSLSLSECSISVQILQNSLAAGDDVMMGSVMFNSYTTYKTAKCNSFWSKQAQMFKNVKCCYMVKKWGSKSTPQSLVMGVQLEFFCRLLRNAGKPPFYNRNSCFFQSLCVIAWKCFAEKKWHNLNERWRMISEW